MSNEELISRIRQGEQLEGELYQQNRPIIAAFIKPYIMPGVEPEDLMQESYLALHEAVQRYDESLDIKFMSYAAHWIRCVCRRYIDNHCKSVRLPVYRSEQVRKYKAILAEHEITGESLSGAELCRRLDVKPWELKEIKAAAGIQTVSLSEPIGDELELADVLPDDADQFSLVEDKMQNEQLRAEIEKALDELDEKNAETIRLKYFDNLSYEQIGEKSGISGTAAQRRAEKAIRELRKPRLSKRLREFIEDSYTMAYHGSLGEYRKTFTSSTERAAIRIAEGYRP